VVWLSVVNSLNDPTALSSVTHLTTGGKLITYNDNIIGTCSICSGPVTVPTVYWSTTPPVPQCQRCGAYAQESYGKVIPMRPAGKRYRPEDIFGPRDSGFNDNVFDDGHKVDIKWG